MRERPLSFAVIALALAGAATLLGWSSVAGALSHEENVRLRLTELRPEERAVQVVYHLTAGERDERGSAVARFFEEIEHLTTSARRVELWHSIGPQIRVVVPGELVEDTVVTRGRRPTGCHGGVCEALALAGDFAVGQRLRLGNNAVVEIVGRGSLNREALPLETEALPRTPELTSRALLVASLDPPLAGLARDSGSSFVTTAPLDPTAIHAADLRSVAARLRTKLIRIERETQSENTAPLAVLHELADRGQVARERLLLVAGQGAALIIAFAAFAASARRSDTRLLDEQLATLGASRIQIATVRIVEAVAPSLAGAAAALSGLSATVWLLERRRELGSGFAAAALPFETVVAIAGMTAGAIVLLFAAATSVRRSRFGFGALELAAVTALAVVAWQTAATGALDPERIESEERAGPVLLLVPALAFFATGVLLLRVVPFALRLGERLTRTAPFAIRLAFVTAARTPAHAAATTTFLAIALGSALFGLNYRATLERQARDEARFTSGASWRVAERAAANPSQPAAESRVGDTNTSPTGADVSPVTGAADVTPLSRFGLVSAERPTPVLRLPGRVPELGLDGEAEDIEVVALPASRLGKVLGWRDEFSTLTRGEIAARLRSGPVRLTGVRVADDARALRVRMRADTRLPRFAVLHFLLPHEQSFAHLRLGELTRGWRTLSLRLPRSLPGAELVGIEFPPLYVPFSLPPDFGTVEVGRFEQLRPGRWSPLAPIDDWVASTVGGSVNVLRMSSGPVKERLQFFVKDAPQALIRPSLDLPDPLPVLASGPVTGAAVDGVITLNLQGRELRARVAGTARLFPTVIEEPSRFVVVDYETLFAALNVDQPGLAVPSETWFFAPQRPGFLAALEDPPFRVAAAVGLEPLTERLLTDPLAAGTRQVLGLAALAAAALALLGLVLAARATLASERLLLAEYEALGVPPATLARSTQIRLVALSSLGVAAGILGGLLAVRLIGAFVAVTGTAARPLPPIEPVVAWKAGSALLTVVVLAAVGTAAIFATQALRETAARRLRA
jgi:hypothetical protein